VKFDWYQATIEREPEYIRSALAEASGGDWMHVRPSRKAAKAQALVVDGEPLLELLEEGLYKSPHVIATGSTAHHSATIIRAACPEHLVARADVCEDLEAPGWFDHAFTTLLALSRSERVKPERKGDWDSDETSRSFYLGSPKSPSMIRLYEKGMEQRAKYPHQADDFPRDWSRLEIQVRPLKRDDKLKMASRPAPDFFGCSRVGRKAASMLLGHDAPRIRIGSTWSPRSELERREFFMIQQYHATLRERRDLTGSAAAFGEHLCRLLQAHESRRN